MIGPVATFGGIASVVGVLGYLHIQSLHSKIEVLETAKLSLESKIETCEARQANITEDRKSDAEVDAMPDLTDVPDSWIMRPGSAADR